jgi:hypothetical protein
MKIEADTNYLKPLPNVSPDTEPYWDGLMQGRLLLQKCSGCGKLRNYPRPMCDACYSMESKWVEASGKGTIHSWTITHHAFNIGFKGELPYILVTVDLAEGVRLQAPLRNADARTLKIGAPVKVIFERPKSDLTTPAFVLA